MQYLKQWRKWMPVAVKTVSSLRQNIKSHAAARPPKDQTPVTAIILLRWVVGCSCILTLCTRTYVCSKTWSTVGLIYSSSVPRTPWSTGSSQDQGSVHTVCSLHQPRAAPGILQWWEDTTKQPSFQPHIVSSKCVITAWCHKCNLRKILMNVTTSTIHVDE